jgi:hypothetical protein
LGRVVNNQRTWRSHLAPYTSGVVLFDQSFIDQWGDQIWPHHDASADDVTAAAGLHVQLISRITTQHLPYGDGVEATALKSVYELFGQAREIFKKHSQCRLTDAITWHVLNTHVRPFTAKWHRQSERGALSAVDATDVFRDELASLQKVLTHFDALLVEIRDGCPPPPVQKNGESERERRIAQEMQRSLAWGIDSKLGGLNETVAGQINAKEKEAVKDRRRHYHERLNRPFPSPAPNTDNAPPDATGTAAAPTEVTVTQGAPSGSRYPAAWIDRPHATALAISGGGVRSATFALGVLVALARRNLLFQFDYLSTVSGGGYLGAFLTTFLNTQPPNQTQAGLPTTEPRPEIGLFREDLPFRREDGEAAALRHIRHHSKYLVTGRLWERLQMTFTQVYGMAFNGLAFAYLAVVAAIVEYALRRVLPIGALWVIELVLSVVVAVGAFVISMGAHTRLNVQKVAGNVITGASLAFIALLLWWGLQELHVFSHANWWLLAGAASIPLLASALLALAGNLPFPIRVVLLVLSVLAAPVLFFVIEANAYATMSNLGLLLLAVIIGPAVLVGLFLLYRFDINFTSPHRYYKRKLGEAYLVQPGVAQSGLPLREGVSLPLSKCTEKKRAPYHLVNCALDVPASDNPAMQGRLTDFFLFSPFFFGSPLLGYDGSLRGCGRAADGDEHDQEFKFLACIVQCAPWILDS